MKIARLGEGPELFYSLQGEGVSMGRPSVFLRLALCNLQCSWCDTAYSWKWKPGEKERHVVDWPEKRIAEEIRSFPVKHVVVTGGEPLLQQEALIRLCVLLPGYTFEIETNGTLVPDERLDSFIGQYNVSPKLGHSGNASARSLVPESLEWFAVSPKAWFKFVVGDPADVDEVQSLQDRYGMSCDRVLLMPKGTTSGELTVVRSWLADECLKRAYRLTDRLHVHLWGSRPGV